MRISMNWWKSLLPIAGSLAGAFLSLVPLACCLLPATFGLLGAATLVAGATLMPYRPYFIGATVLFLAIGFYSAYHASVEACRNGECCAPKPGSRTIRWVLWIVAIVCALALMGPYLLPYLQI